MRNKIKQFVELQLKYKKQLELEEMNKRIQIEKEKQQKRDFEVYKMTIKRKINDERSKLIP